MHVVSIILFASGTITGAYTGNYSTEIKKTMLNRLFQNVDGTFKLFYDSIIDFPETTNNTIRSSQFEMLPMNKRTLTGDERWICDTRFEWKDLSADFHPRFVREAVCVQTSCVRGFYTCQPYHYALHVLSRRGANEFIDFDIPRELRNEWKFVTMNLAVGCECGRTN